MVAARGWGERLDAPSVLGPLELEMLGYVLIDGHVTGFGTSGMRGAVIRVSITSC